MNAPIQILGVRRHWLSRTRYQLLGGLLFAILLPALIRASFAPHVILESNMQTTIVAAIVAHVTGFFIYRRIGTFPGVAAAGYILPTFLLAYGIVFVAIFIFRFEYSRFQAVGSFTLSTLWYFSLSVATRRLETYSLAVIPGGDINRLDSIQGIAWRHLSSTGLPLGRVNGVVADLRADLSDDWERFIADSALSGIPVYHVKQVSESLTGRVEIEHLSENTLGSLNPNQAYIKIKQAIDWLGALVIMIVFLPLWVLIAGLIKLDSPGPALYRQERVGYRGQVFTLFKFRSMRYLDEQASDEREQAITKDNDARITRIGKFLRKTRFDELPQVINILRGEMSWIGPRPEALALSHWYEQELAFYRYRHIVRPGITGWAQINQGHVADVNEVLEKLQYDFYYIKNFSPWLDVVIVMKTIKTMLTGYGAR